MMRWKIVPSYAGFLTHAPLGSFHGRTPRASPTKLATVMGALSSKSLHSSLPRSVSMVALRGPLPGSPAVASARENTPFSGSSGEGLTLATGRAGFGGAGSTGAWVGSGAGVAFAVGFAVAVGVALLATAAGAFTGSSLAPGLGSGGADWQAASKRTIEGTRRGRRAPRPGEFMRGPLLP